MIRRNVALDDDLWKFPGLFLILIMFVYWKMWMACVGAVSVRAFVFFRI